MKKKIKTTIGYALIILSIVGWCLMMSGLPWYGVPVCLGFGLLICFWFWLIGWLLGAKIEKPDPLLKVGYDELKKQLNKLELENNDLKSKIDGALNDAGNIIERLGPLSEKDLKSTLLNAIEEVSQAAEDILETLKAKQDDKV